MSNKRRPKEPIVQVRKKLDIWNLGVLVGGIITIGSLIGIFLLYLIADIRPVFMIAPLFIGMVMVYACGKLGGVTSPKADARKAEMEDKVNAIKSRYGYKYEKKK